MPFDHFSGFLTTVYISKHYNQFNDNISASHLPISFSPVQQDVPVRLPKSRMSITVRYNSHTVRCTVISSPCTQPRGANNKALGVPEVAYRHNKLLN